VGVYGAGAYDLSGSIYLLFGGIYPATLRSDSLHLQVFAYVTQELQILSRNIGRLRCVRGVTAAPHRLRELLLASSARMPSMYSCSLESSDLGVKLDTSSAYILKLSSL